MTAVAPVRFVPVRVTAIPTGPLVGAKLAIVGAVGPVTEKLAEEAALPSGVVTLILPVVAPLGTVALNCVALNT